MGFPLAARGIFSDVFFFFGGCLSLFCSSLFLLLVSLFFAFSSSFSSVFETPLFPLPLSFLSSVWVSLPSLSPAFSLFLSFFSFGSASFWVGFGISPVSSLDT